MKIKKLDIKTVTYQYDDEWRVMITEQEDPDNKGYKVWYAYLGHEEYGPIDLMCGCCEYRPAHPDGNETFEDFLYHAFNVVPMHIEMYLDKLDILDDYYNDTEEE